MKFKDAIDNFRFVDNWYSYSVNLVLAQILQDADGRCLEARLGDLTLTLEKRSHFSIRNYKLFFLLSSGETRL